MKLVVLFLVITGIFVLWSFRDTQSLKNSARVSREAVHSTRGPVVVELFTSEGCSSCPPADELLSKLDQQSIAGVDTIVLGQHVDYWNQLGWRDPYSSSEFSVRQRLYAEALNTRSVYTPQMVVDGREEFVGSDVGKAREAIVRAAGLPKARIEVGYATDLQMAKEDEIKLSIKVTELPGVTAGDAAEVVLAITESKLSSEVSRGENAGRHLKHSAVVRQLSVVGEIAGDRGNFEAQKTVRLPKSWQRGNLRAVVFVQERGTRRVLGAAALKL